MRDIKFRAWNKTQKCMDTEFSIHAAGCIYQDAKRRWDISDIAIETAYDESRAPIIYCEKCYQQEVY